METWIINLLRDGFSIALKIQLEKLDQKLDQISLNQLRLLFNSVYGLRVPERTPTKSGHTADKMTNGLQGDLLPDLD